VLSREARMTQGIDRREFLTRLGVTVGGAMVWMRLRPTGG